MLSNSVPSSSTISSKKQILIKICVSVSVIKEPKFKGTYQKLKQVYS